MFAILKICHIFVRSIRHNNLNNLKMKALELNPQIFTVTIDTFHGEVSFDLLTIDGEQPNETIYFLAKGDVPSSNEVDQINKKVEDAEWEVSSISDDDMIAKYSIDVTIFDGSGNGYEKIVARLNELQDKY